ncbi:hypothetical protein H4R18_000558 [Coemansia javaensis]|uniref:Ubiquitin-like domain-containing protein n=1 Tax=Coemansia javaensis TaxID=2761396 RepID=A0A9W8LMU7_9FUNG|nr:hypothetical protein H4R18_000558 [Coemansia javaensis]
MLATLLGRRRASKTYGNPFESNMLVRMAGQRSFFVHELPPDCSVAQLRERIRERAGKHHRAGEWELYLPRPDAVVLRDGRQLSDYGIRPWDCIHARPATTTTATAAAQARRGVRGACAALARGRAAFCKRAQCPGGATAAAGFSRTSSSESLFSYESFDAGGSGHGARCIL